MKNARVRYRLLGPLEVSSGDELVTPSGRAQRALLIVLLLHANEAVSAERLLDDLWPSTAPRSGRAALQVRISHLRKQLGPAGAAVVRRPPGYAITVGAGELDLHRFEELVAEADAADAGRAAMLLREALGLWRGEALADVAYEPFAQPAIARLEELRLAALERRIDADLELGRHAELAGELEALVSEHPLRERLRGQQMLALYRAGRQADALQSFASAREILLDQLGLEPGPVLRRLQSAILRQDASLDLAGAPAPDRTLLAVARGTTGIEGLLALAEPLARKPPRELIVACLVAGPDDVAVASTILRSRQETLVSREIVARTSCFTSVRPADDAIRLAAEQDADLLLFHASDALLDDPFTRLLLEGSPCDVGVLIARDGVPDRPVLVPFGGGEHDWTAIELAAWLASSSGVPLRLAGPREPDRDASRLLASASLAIQRAFGVTAEPLLVEPGPAALVAAAAGAGLVVVGLSERWQRDGLGEVRGALAASAEAPVLLARNGPRPGGLAPPESLTRFTWTVRL